jgi:MYXO-CTERM domain-containing protein
VWGGLPLRFERNDGQVDARIRYVARSGGMTLALEDDGPMLVLRHAGGAVRMRVVGARPRADLVADGRLETLTHYLVGNDPKGWRTNIPSFARVTYASILEGVDLTFYGDGARVEYDFVVAPQTRPEAIAFDIDGADSLDVDAAGDLHIKAAGDVLVQSRPRVFQRGPAGEQPVEGRYRVVGDRRVAFEFGPFDRTLALVIDPVLAYATYYGGGGDRGNGIAVDGAGNLYISGYTGSLDLPTKGPYQASNAGGNAGGNDAFVAKLNAAGTSLVYATYLGGALDDRGARIAVDAAGSAYVVGQTSSTDFPTTAGALQKTFGGIRDGFVAKLAPSGSALVYSTYLGGASDDLAWGVAVDPAGEAFVTGVAGDATFPVKNAAQPTYGGGGYDAFVAKLAASGQSLVYSTLLGGSSQDEGADVAVDGAGNAYLLGMTESADFPTHAAVQATCASCSTGTYDLLLAEVAPSGSSFVFSTYLGGNQQDTAGGIALDPQGGIYATGYTFSTDFPTTPGAWRTTSQGTRAGNSDAIVAKLAPSGASVAYATYLGGGNALGSGIAVSAQGYAYAVGAVFSDVLPTVDPIQATLAGNYDAYLTVFTPSGAGVAFSTYLGGSNFDLASTIALDGPGSAVVTGYTESTDFPTHGPEQAANAGGDDAFVVRITGLPGAVDSGAIDAGATDAADAGATDAMHAADAGSIDARDAGGAKDAQLAEAAAEASAQDAAKEVAVEAGVDATTVDAAPEAGPDGGGMDAPPVQGAADAAVADAGPPAADAADAGSARTSRASSGCGCRVGSNETARWPAAIAAFTFALLAVRRRRR